MSETNGISKLILASASPRRKELLEQAGYEFDVVVPTLTEPQASLRMLSPAAETEALAYFKACAVSEQYPDNLVLGADTLVVVGGEILGKPADAKEARRMLMRLSGSRHEVITGVALIENGERLIASDVTWIEMRKITEPELEDYISSGEWRGKAGAYAIQETADRFVEKVDGSFTNVVGLPMELLARMLNELRAHPQAHRTV